MRSAARLVAQVAIASGLWAAQRDDYPVSGEDRAQRVGARAQPGADRLHRRHRSPTRWRSSAATG